MEKESEGISMNNIVEADYTIVQARTLPVIASEIHQIERTVYGVALDGAIQIGRKLQEAKEMIPSGEWVKWLDENLNYSQRQAYNFMEIADNYGDENSPFYDLQTSANVSISKALELLRLPEGEVKSFAEEHDIESETVKSLRDEINNLKRERDRAEDNNESLRKDLARAQSDLAEAMTQEDADRIRGQYEAAREELQTENAKIKEEQSELQAKLDKAKEDLKKQKAKLKEIEASMDEEVQKRISEAETEVQAKAHAHAEAEMEGTLRNNAEEIARLEEQIERLEAENAKLSNTTLKEFKVYVDQLQDAFDKAGECILDAEADSDPELSNKMNAALKKVLQGMMEDL